MPAARTLLGRGDPLEQHRAVGRHRGDEAGLVERDVQGRVAAHRDAQQRSPLPAGDDAVGGFDVGDEILRHQVLVAAARRVHEERVSAVDRHHQELGHRAARAQAGEDRREAATLPEARSPRTGRGARRRPGTASRRSCRRKAGRPRRTKPPAPGPRTGTCRTALRWRPAGRRARGALPRGRRSRISWGDLTRGRGGAAPWRVPRRSERAVSRPVKVFCWETWKEQKRRTPPPRS